MVCNGGGGGEFQIIPAPTLDSPRFRGTDCRDKVPNRPA